MSAPLLLVDAGNSRLKWATAEANGPIVAEGELTARDGTSELIEEIAKQYPRHNVVLSSVVPRLVPYFLSSFPDRLHQVTSNSPALALLYEYPKPNELGADRLAAAAVVRHEGTLPAIIVQCGTATAFSVLDDDGRFRGGIIAPGLHAQLDSLVGATAQLPTIKLHHDSASLGTSTEQAIRLGVLLNYQGGVNAILRHLCKQGKPPLTSIILTGGNTHLLEDSLEFPFTLRPLLVFEGLRIIGLRAFKDV